MEQKTKKLLKTIKINAASNSHIEIGSKSICYNQCQEKYCTKFCPTNVFSWSATEKKIVIKHQQCIECLACPFGCPYQNINWKFPPSGYGVEY